MKKLKGLILHFTLKFIMEFTMNVRRGNIFFFEVSKNFPSCIVCLSEKLGLRNLIKVKPKEISK